MTETPKTDGNTPVLSLQEIIFKLQRFWSSRGCVVMQPYDMEVGAGTFHPATTLRSLGRDPWRAVYVQPCRRPADGRYGENPNRLQHYYQMQVILKPSPSDVQDLYLQSLAEIDILATEHDIRFVEDDWESPALGAWGLGWECWCDGMEVSQFTYFQQMAGVECSPVPVEITYGLERLAMFVQRCDNLYDLVYANGVGGEGSGGEGPGKSILYGDVFHQAEVEYSAYNFDYSNVDMLRRHFDDAEQECSRLLELTPSIATKGGVRHVKLVLPAYDQCIKASHLFNQLDARGNLSVTERQGYILRVRHLSKICGAAYLENQAQASKAS